MFLFCDTLYILQLASICIFVLFQAPVEITACEKNVTNIIIPSGQTAILSYSECPSSNCDDSFLGYRVFRRNESFTYLGKGEHVGNCTQHSHLKNFCVSKTQFEKLDDTLILMIRSATVDDGGPYGVEYLFKNLSGNSKEEKCLEVQVEATTSALQSTQDYIDKPGKSTSPIPRSDAMSSSVPAMLLLLLLCLSLWLRHQGI